VLDHHAQPGQVIGEDLFGLVLRQHQQPGVGGAQLGHTEQRGAEVKLNQSAPQHLATGRGVRRVSPDSLRCEPLSGPQHGHGLLPVRPIGGQAQPRSV
jgi:hypothetical protein